MLGGVVVLHAADTAQAAQTISGVQSEVIEIGGTTDGQPINASARIAGYSADGNILVFSSQATNLPSAGGTGLYTYNVRSGSLARVDVSTAGSIADRPAYSVKVSESGRYITFESSASNLLDTAYVNKDFSIYQRDVQAGITKRVGMGLYNGNYSQNRERNLGISHDGRIRLAASRYINSTYPYTYRIVVSDNATTTGNAWTTLGVGDGNENSWSSSAVNGDLNCDGSYALFSAYNDITLADLRKNSTPVLTQLATGGSSPKISCNGRYALYTTLDRTISPTPAGLSNYRHHLVRHDLLSGERMYINSNSAGVFTSGFQPVSGMEPYENVYNASISDTGDVVFNYNGNVYLKHLSDGSGTLESIAKTTSGNYIFVQNGGITRDGRYIYFSADPSLLGLSSSPSDIKIIRTKTNL